MEPQVWVLWHRCGSYGATGWEGVPLTLTDRSNSMDRRRGASTERKGMAQSWAKHAGPLLLTAAQSPGSAVTPCSSTLFLHEQKFPPQVVSMTSDNAHPRVLRALSPACETVPGMAPGSGQSPNLTVVPSSLGIYSP